MLRRLLPRPDRGKSETDARHTTRADLSGMKHSGPKPPASTGSRAGQPRTTGAAPRQAPRAAAGHKYGTSTALNTLAPPPGLPPVAPVGPSSIVDTATQLHDRHGEQIRSGSEALSVPPAATAAVLLAEGQFAPTPVDDRMAIRFEPYVFYQQTGRWLVATHKDQTAEYRAFSEAQAIDPGAAHLALRMGVAQLSGAEANAAGYDTPEAMRTALEQDPAAQVAGLLSVIAADTGLRDALAAQDWRQVAQLRAGPGFGALGYDDALAACADAYRRVQHGGGDDDDGKPKRKKKG